MLGFNFLGDDLCGEIAEIKGDMTIKLVHQPGEELKFVVRMVVGARPPRHGDSARPHHRGHPVRLGAPEARRAGAVADREGDRAGADRAAPMAAASLRLAASISCKCLPAKPLLAATLECYNCDA